MMRDPAPQSRESESADRHTEIFTSDNSQLSLPNSIGLKVEKPETLELQSAVNRYIAAALSTNTRRAYQGDIQDFLRWGGTVPSSPETLAMYLADRAKHHSPHTIRRRLVGISRAHTSQNFEDPAKSDLIRLVLHGVRRTHWKRQRQVAPLVKAHLIQILPYMTGIKGMRDRALLLLGFAAALRRSELVALDVEDLQPLNEGLLIQVRKSKCDQMGEGREIAVPWGRTSACTVKAIQEWIEQAKIREGPLFRRIGKGGTIRKDRLTAQSVALIVKHYIKAAGLPANRFSGHSMRSGFVTSAAQAGVSSWKIREQTGHKSDAMLEKYIRAANRFENNAAVLIL